VNCRRCANIRTRLVDWFIALCCRYGREDHLMDIDGNGHYMRRWELIRTPWFGVRLHNTLRPDLDRYLHDHPWANVSIILKGFYVEALPLFDEPTFVMHAWRGVMVEPVRNVTREAGAVIFRRACDRHSLTALSCVPCWSLFIVGPHRRGWCFYTPAGMVPADEYKAKGKQ